MKSLLSKVFEFLDRQQVRHGVVFHFIPFVCSLALLPVNVVLAFLLDQSDFAFVFFEIGLFYLIGLTLSFSKAIRVGLRKRLHPYEYRSYSLSSTIGMYALVFLVIVHPCLLAIFRILIAS